MEQCQSASVRTAVNDNLLSFDLLMDQVLTDSFIHNLPVTFKSFKQEEEKKTEDISPRPTKLQSSQDYGNDKI